MSNCFDCEEQSTAECIYCRKRYCDEHLAASNICRDCWEDSAEKIENDELADADNRYDEWR